MEQITIIENAINNIAGVISSKVVAGSNLNEIHEVHVLANPSRNPKQVSKDIQTLFAVQLNRNLDHRVISVATINALIPKTEEPRPKFVGIEHGTIDGQFRVAVHLKAGENHLVGQAEGLYSEKRNLKFVVESTIQALAPMLKPNEAILMEDLDIATLNKERVALVYLSLARNGEEIPLVGSSIVVESPYESFVKATLDAVNRKLFC